MALKPNQLQLTIHNPQSTSIIEQLHKVVNDLLRSFDSINNHKNIEEQDNNPFDYFLQSTEWAIRSTYHTILQVTLCQLVFLETNDIVIGV
jgi:hypothetical protein